MPLPSIGGGAFSRGGGPCIKLFLHGHANRPFFHIIITSKFAPLKTHPVEQLGTYDPMPNTENQKLLSLNIERTRYWMGQGATFSTNAAKLLGFEVQDKCKALYICRDAIAIASRQMYTALDKCKFGFRKAGFLPIHPETYMKAWRNRYKVADDEEAKKAAEATAESGPSQPPSSSSS